MNIAICDIIQHDRADLSEYISKYCREQLWDCQIDEYSSCDELQESCRYNSYNMIFIDLYNCGTKGLECVGSIRKLDPDVIFVFIADFGEYFQEGYGLGVRNYLVKPIEESCVRSSVRRNSKYVLKQSLEVISEENNSVKIPLQDILYIEEQNDYRVIHTGHFLIKTDSSLGELEKRIDSRKFFRCHSCYIVNINAISDLNITSFHIRNGDEIPVTFLESKGKFEMCLSKIAACG